MIIVSTHPKSSPYYHSKKIPAFGEGWEDDYDALIGQNLHWYCCFWPPWSKKSRWAAMIRDDELIVDL